MLPGLPLPMIALGAVLPTSPLHQWYHPQGSAACPWSSSSAFDSTQAYWQHSGARLYSPKEFGYPAQEVGSIWRVNPSFAHGEARMRAQQRGCRNELQGQYWAVGARYCRRLLLRENQSQAARDRISRASCKEEFTTVCAPGTCHVRQVVAYVQKHLASWSHCGSDALFSWRLPHEGSMSFSSVSAVTPSSCSSGEQPSLNISATELEAWEDLNISWAVAAIHHCGTSSVVANLALHPALSVRQASQWMEDGAIFMHHQFLPHRINLARFVEPRPCAASESAHCRWGVKWGGYYESPHAMLRLAASGVRRIIFMIDNPIRRMEWHYLKNYAACFLESNKTKSADMTSYPSMARCVEVAEVAGVACFLRCHDNGLFALKRTDFMVHVQIASAVQLFSRYGVFLGDKSYLAKGGRSFFDQLARFVGVSRFAEDHTFHRASLSKPSRRALLCSLERRQPETASQNYRDELALLGAFSLERRRLKSWFLKLPPHLPGLPLPGWLATDTPAPRVDCSIASR